MTTAAHHPSCPNRLDPAGECICPDWTQPDHAFHLEGLTYAVGRLVDAVDMLGEAVVGLDGLTWDQAAVILERVQAARQTLHRSESAVETYTVKAMRAAKVKQAPIEGVGLFEVRQSKDRRQWDHDALAAAVLDHHLTERADGELPDPWEVRDWILAAAAPGYWRTTVLRGLGIDPDDYCASQPGRPSVQITRPTRPPTI